MEVGENTMEWRQWYDSLDKPSWTPEPQTIGLVWQILYPVIIITFSIVFYRALRGKIPRMVSLPFAINLIANLIFTPIQFRLRDLNLAAIDIVVIWGTIVWCIIAIWPHSRWIAIAQVPYLIWVTIATTLQLYITWNN